ncbi:hypothetical protein BX666DRAFT_2120365 [Dichotomocladium elegans]|nr:hypothetical protein BX666DRAFT_2120365 [Dichotomocladium elegans]
MEAFKTWQHAVEAWRTLGTFAVSDTGWGRCQTRTPSRLQSSSLSSSSTSSSTSSPSKQLQDHTRLKRKWTRRASSNGSIRQQPPRSAKVSSAQNGDCEQKDQIPRPARKRRCTRTSQKEVNGNGEVLKQRKQTGRPALSNHADDLNHSTPQHHRSLRAGDAVEALKWTEDSKEWYCARVVTILGDPPEKNHGDKKNGGEEYLLFVHYEGFDADHADWVDGSSVRPLSGSRDALRYGPKGKESDASWADYRTFYYSKEADLYVKHHTGLVQDLRMLWHTCPCHSRKAIHPERPDRICCIVQALHADRTLRYFQRIRAREATLEELLLVHRPSHVRNYCAVNHETVADNLMTESNARRTTILALLNAPPPPSSENTTPSPSCPNSPSPPPQQKESIVRRTHGVEGGEVVKADKNHIKQQRRRFSSAAASDAVRNGAVHMITPPGLIYEMTCGELGIAVDTPFHPLYTSISARIAAGALMELTDQVVQGKLRNGFALIRPPGHHAEDDGAMGFCFFNNVAVTVASTLEKYPTKIKKVLIIDWDIHHGNGTQKIFYESPEVLYISLHRWENGHFYPFSGSPDECGRDEGLGKNVNIAFNTDDEKPKPMGDVEFIAAFYHIVLPIARQFNPDMIFVSAGFDAAEGHPANIGGYQVTPRGFAMLTKMTKELAEEVCDGRLVLSLEGGYELQPLATSVAACVAQLLSPVLVPDVQINYKGSLNTIKPNRGAAISLRRVAEIQRTYWKLPEELVDPNYRFLLPADWRAKDSISTRPKRSAKPANPSIVEGY